VVRLSPLAEKLRDATDHRHGPAPLPIHSPKIDLARETTAGEPTAAAEDHEKRSRRVRPSTQLSQKLRRRAAKRKRRAKPKKKREAREEGERWRRRGDVPRFGRASATRVRPRSATGSSRDAVRQCTTSRGRLHAQPSSGARSRGFAEAGKDNYLRKD